jgi:hypothetical protein
VKKLRTATTTPTKPRKGQSDPESDGEVELATYKDALRKKGKQTAASPVKPHEWKVWTCDRPNAKILRANFPGTLSQNDLEGEGLLEVAELLCSHANVGTKEALKTKYEEKAGSAPNARWAKIDIIVGVVAEVIKR